MSKFTPGPWDYDETGIDECEKSAHFHPGHDDTFLSEAICIVPHDDITEDGAVEIKANMHLIAAATDMYHFINMLEGTPETIAILAKARGEK